MKTCCELPNCMLDKNLELNDYDFILYHLYLENKSYKEYYDKLREEHPERITILDNSAYEFYIQNKTLDVSAFIDCINTFKPTYFIIPDKLSDYDYTRKYASIFKNIEIESIGIPVIQGSNESELVKCINYYSKLGYDYIAIPFHLDLYKDLEPNTATKVMFYNEYNTFNDDIRYAMGRVTFINKHKKLLSKFKKIHFLGSHCPLEKLYYKDYESIDTSYPVKLGIENIELFKEQAKPNIILDDFIDNELDGKTKCLIENNIKKFKKL